MSRYAAMFDRLNGDGALGAFVMLGDPDLETSAHILEELVEAGADPGDRRQLRRRQVASAA